MAQRYDDNIYRIPVTCDLGGYKKTNKQTDKMYNSSQPFGKDNDSMATEILASDAKNQNTLMCLWGDAQFIHTLQEVR